MAELVDALDSKSSSARSAGSIPARGTKLRCFAASLGAANNPALSYAAAQLVRRSRIGTLSAGIIADLFGMSWAIGIIGAWCL